MPLFSEVLKNVLYALAHLSLHVEVELSASLHGSLNDVGRGSKPS